MIIEDAVKNVHKLLKGSNHDELIVIFYFKVNN